MQDVSAWILDLKYCLLGVADDPLFVLPCEIKIVDLLDCVMPRAMLQRIVTSGGPEDDIEVRI